MDKNKNKIKEVDRIKKVKRNVEILNSFLYFFIVSIRVETSTDFATRVPDIHYPTGTRVLVTVNLVSD